MNIGAIIKARRKARGLTQLTLAMRLGVTPQAVGKWERGESEPDLTLLCPLAKELNVTLETLFGLEQKAGYVPVDLSMEQLRDDLKARRTAAGLTQAELAAKLGLRPQTVSKWETGVCAPDLDYLNRLCALYGITPTALFSERVPQTAAHTSQAEPSPPAVAADKAHEHTPATRGAPLAAPTGTPAAAAKAPFFAGKPLRVLALVLVLALLLSAVLAPLLLFGGNASGQVSDGGSDITGGGTDEPTDPPDEGTDEPETPPDEGTDEPETPPDSGTEEPTVEPDLYTLTFYDGLTNTGPNDSGVCGFGKVPEGAVLALEENAEKTTPQKLVAYYEGSVCFEYELGVTRFDDYIAHGCFDKEGDPYSFPIDVTEDTSFYQQPEAIWIDYFSYDTYAEQLIGQEICTQLRMLCENLLYCRSIYNSLQQSIPLSPDTPRDILLGWAGVPDRQIGIIVGESEERVAIHWQSDLSVLRERLAQLAETDPQTAKEIRDLVNEHFIVPLATFFYAVGCEEIPLDEGVFTALSYFETFAASMPSFYRNEYAAFMEELAGIPAYSFPTIRIEAQYLV